MILDEWEIILIVLIILKVIIITLWILRWRSLREARELRILALQNQNPRTVYIVNGQPQQQQPPNFTNSLREARELRRLALQNQNRRTVYIVNGQPHVPQQQQPPNFTNYPSAPPPAYSPSNINPNYNYNIGDQQSNQVNQVQNGDPKIFR